MRLRDQAGGDERPLPPHRQAGRRTFEDRLQSGAGEEVFATEPPNETPNQQEAIRTPDPSSVI